MLPKRTTWIVPSDKAGNRLDIILSMLPIRISRTQWKRLIKTGMVTVGGLRLNPSHVLKGGEVIEITIPPPEPLELQPEAIPLDIIYEDEYLIVINKPTGLVVHPGAGNKGHTLVNALLHHCPNLSGIGGKQRPGIVHRIDKDTSGLLMVAKTEEVHQSLSLQIKEKRVTRLYVALVYGCISGDKGEIRTIIGRHPVQRKKMSIYPKKGRIAITSWEVKERFKAFTWLEISLRTGRTHQIRVHMAHIGHPVVGDKVYGQNRSHYFKESNLKTAIAALPGQALHARTLGFYHPVTNQYLEFSAAPPKVIKDILDILEGKRS